MQPKSYEFHLHGGWQRNGLDELCPFKRLLEGSTVSDINQPQAKRLLIAAISSINPDTILRIEGNLKLEQAGIIGDCGG